MIEACEVLRMPEKITPIITEFNAFRYFLLEGGRGGGKTQGVARLIAYICEKRRVRVFCGRETQATIQESVYTVFKDIIVKYNLNFKIFNDKIIHNTTGSEIRFKGFREQGMVNIKGMEGVDILWIDEAQAITQKTLDTIIPTIRKEKAKIFFTMNRYLKGDPVYKMFNNREDCLHITINYDENPFISDALLNEANECKRSRPDDYKHIWRGLPLSNASNYLFNEDALDECLTREFPHDPNKYGARILGGDCARFGDNYSAGVIMKQCGPDHWEEEYLERWKKHDAIYSTGKFNEMISIYHPNYTIIDSDGLGGPIFDYLSANNDDIIPFHGGSTRDLPLGHDKKPMYKNWRTCGYLTLEKLVNNGRLRLKSKFIVDQLKEIKYKYDLGMNKFILPKEQLIEDARKKGVPYNSPDEADAVMMAMSRAEQLKEEMAEMYTSGYGRIRDGGNQSYAYESDLI